jgi:hypothetical protein
MSILPPSDVVPTNAADTLVILLHGVNAHPKRLRFVHEAVTQTLDNVDVLVPALPFGLFSFVDLNELTWELVAHIDQACADRMRCADGRPYSRIILVGHSLGALLARKIYVYACGQNETAPFELTQYHPERGEPRAWASSVERIILMAGLNRGWTISHHVSLPKILLARLAIVVGNILHLFMRSTYLYFQFRRGAPLTLSSHC